MTGHTRRQVGRELGRTLQLALPVMMSRAGILVMVAVDTAMSGHAGSEHIGFYSVGAAPLIPLIVLSVALLTATMVMTAQAEGANQSEQVGSILYIGLFFAVLLGLMALFVTRYAQPALTLFGQTEEMVAGAAPVVRALGLGMPALTIYATISFFLEALHRPKVGMVAMLIANILNIGFNWIFVFGNLGATAMGAEGAAIATTITRYLLAAGMLAFLWVSVDHKHYGFHRLTAKSRQLAKRFLRIGWPMALGTGLESTAFAALMLMAGVLGSVEVGAYAIAHNLNAIAFMLALGLSTAAGIRTGNAWGRQDTAGIRWAGWVAVLSGAGLLILVAIIFLALKSQLVAIYTSDIAVVSLAIAVMPFMAASLIPDGTQVIVIGALRGANDFWTGALAQFVGFWIVMVPLGWYFGIEQQGGARILLLAVFCGALVSLGIASARFFKIADDRR